ncbi:MAG: segregation and condensation protein A [Legionellales bacterium RIFCSPHIGHO2_12_FULL_42_9]|nr:MAG: segregation and condensation protein A [Legionellales bacterium RIFCSPHIGHO2_12_FULL_42_9]
MTEFLATSPPPILAVIDGQPMTTFPDDLFIPPDALKVLLDSFTGPLDLLCYLIRRQNIDIMNIPIALITRQYMDYIQLMEENRFELAAEYLVMAAMLAEIKSRLLLPPTVSEEGEEEDPRLSLVRKLEAYEQMKIAAKYLDELPRCERDLFRIKLTLVLIKLETVHPEVQLHCLSQKMSALLMQQRHVEPHQIKQDSLSVRDRMTFILDQLQGKKQILFHQLWTKEEGRLGLVVTFLAVLELTRQSLLNLTQPTVRSPIYLMVNDDA